MNDRMNELVPGSHTGFHPGQSAGMQSGGNPEVDIKDFSAMLRRRNWVILPILLLCLLGAYVWTINTAKTWRAEAQLQLVPQQIFSSTTPTNNNSVPETPESMETQVAMIQSSEMMERTLDQLKNDSLVHGGSSDTGYTMDSVQDAVKVTNPLDTTILDITADGSNRTQAQTLANAVAHAFVLWKKDNAQKNIRSAEESLRFRAAKAQTQMQDAEQRETNFKEKHHLANVAGEQMAALTANEQSDASISMLHQELFGQKARLQALETQLKAANTAVHSNNGVPDGNLVVSLQAKLDDLHVQRVDAALLYTKDYPGILPGLDARIKNIQAQLDRALRAASSNDAPSLESRSALVSQRNEARVILVLTQARLNAAVQAGQGLQQKVLGLPTIQMQYAQLDRQTELAVNLYTQLQASLNAIRLDRDRVSGNAQLIQSAFVPLVPFKPNLKTNMALGTALGLLLSLCMVLLLEHLDRRIRTLDEVRSLISGPIIGMLPRTPRGYMTALASGRQLPEFEEAFSLVRVNLAYVQHQSLLREEAAQQTILVTSALPGEGKSVAAAQLARSMAAAGKTVILVDANLRRPAKNSLFPGGKTGGLADVLAGTMVLDEALATTDVEGLTVLPAGESTQNPTVLLSHPRLADLMASLRFKAEVVIIDAPDCSSVADSLLLTAHADCLMQVVRLNFADMDSLHNASLALHATGKKVTVLANGLTRSQQRTFRSRFSYAALSSTVDNHAAPKFEQPVVMSRPQDLVFANSASHKSLEMVGDLPEHADPA